MTEKKTPASAEKVPFEEAMSQLDGVVKKLESGEGTLEEMIRLYEQGMKLVTECNERLDAYEAKITKLSQSNQEERHDNP